MLYLNYWWVFLPASSPSLFNSVSYCYFFSHHLHFNIKKIVYSVISGFRYFFSKKTWNSKINAALLFLFTNWITRTLIHDLWYSSVEISFRFNKLSYQLQNNENRLKELLKVVKIVKFLFVYDYSSKQFRLRMRPNYRVVIIIFTCGKCVKCIGAHQGLILTHNNLEFIIMIIVVHVYKQNFIIQQKY